LLTITADNTTYVQLQTAENWAGASWSWVGATFSSGRSEPGWRPARPVSIHSIIMFLMIFISRFN